MNAPTDATLSAPACLACLHLDVPVEEAGTERPTCGPSATAPSAYTTEDRCGLCGSDRLTTDRVAFEVAVADSAETSDYGSAINDRALEAALAHLSDPADMIAVAMGLLDQANVRPRKLVKGCAALGVEVPDWIESLPKRELRRRH